MQAICILLTYILYACNKIISYADRMLVTKCTSKFSKTIMQAECVGMKEQKRKMKKRELQSKMGSIIYGK